MGLRGLINLAKDAHEFGPVALLYGSSLGIFRSKWFQSTLTVRMLLTAIPNRLQGDHIPQGGSDCCQRRGRRWVHGIQVGC